MNLRLTNVFYCASFILFLVVGCRQSPVVEEKAEVPDTTGLSELKLVEYFTDSSAVEAFVLSNNDGLEDSTRIRRFYHLRNYQFAWINPEGLDPNALSFINVLRNAREDGIPMAGNEPDLFLAMIDSLETDSFSFLPRDPLTLQRELRFTALYFQYARSAYRGLPEDKVRALEWYIPRKRISLTNLLDSLFSTQGGSITSNEPVYPLYGRLKSHLRRFRELDKSEVWDSIPVEAVKLMEGDAGELVEKVGRRLYLLCEISDTLHTAFDSTMKSVLLMFQHCHGLKETGLVNTETLDELNRPLADRIRKILLNMERCRWLPSEPRGDFIAVNIPEFRMHVFEGGKWSWASDVIVGKNTSATTIFTGNLQKVVFSPYWNVPRSIVYDEILPQAKRDPGYFRKHHMEIVTRSSVPSVIPVASINWKQVTRFNFRYDIRQKPGPWNSLGKVKFLFPNSYHIYLHDTPSRNLFKETKRSFSRGCIRVSEPLRLASFLLRHDTDWEEAAIRREMNSGIEKTVAMKERVPVFIIYLTAWVDENGRLNFRDDLYGHDEKLARELLIN